MIRRLSAIGGLSYGSVMLTRPQPYEAEAVIHEAEGQDPRGRGRGQGQVFRPRGRGRIRGQVHEAAEIWKTEKFVMVH